MNQTKNIVMKKLNKTIWYKRTEINKKIVRNRDELSEELKCKSMPFILYISVKALRDNQKIPKAIEKHYNEITNSLLEKNSVLKKQISNDDIEKINANTSLYNDKIHINHNDLNHLNVKNEFNENKLDNNSPVSTREILFYETENLMDVKKIFNMSKLPSAYIINNGEIIDSKLNRYSR